MNEHHYAVAVGVNRYPELQSLNSPVGDAVRVADWLGHPDGGGVKADNLRVITVPDDSVPDGMDRFLAEPKKGVVHHALHTFAKRCQQHVEDHPQDWQHTRLYVYVSGHGLAPEPGEAALLLADAGPDWFGENLPCGRFLSFFEAAQYFHEVIFLADCCRYWADDAPLADPPWTKVHGNNGRVVKMTGFATSFGDPAFEPPVDELDPPDQRRSYFTRALIEGLEGKAIDPVSQQIDSNSLSIYVKTRLIELTQRNETNGKPRDPQIPEVFADPAEPIVFRVLSDADSETAAKRQLTIRFTTPFDGDVFLLSGTLQPLERHTVSDAVWSTRVEHEGLYLVQPADGDRPAPIGTPNPFSNQGQIIVVGEAADVEL